MSSITTRTLNAVIVGAPVIFSSIYQAAAQDPRNGEGVLALGVGFSMIFASCPATLGSCLKRNPSKLQQGNSFRVVRLFFAVFGMAFVCYGIYSLARTVIVLQPIQTESPEKTKKVFKKVEMKTCEERVFWAENQFKLCPEAKELWDQSKQAGNFTIICNGSIGANAAVNPHTRTIMINPDHWEVHKIMRSILMELINMKNEKNGGYLAHGCQMTPQQYMIEREKFEYRNTKQVHKLAEKCIARDVWPVQSSFRHHFTGPNPEWGTFELFLDYVERTGHAELHRRHHAKECQHPR